MPNKKYKILISSVGSRVGQAILETLAPQRKDYIVVGTTSTTVALNLYACDRCYLVPLTSDNDTYLASMQAILADEAPDFVIPARDEELLPLGQLSEKKAFSETHFLMAPSQLAPIFNDKYQSFLFAQKQGLSFVQTAFHPHEVETLLHEQGLPLLVKPRWNGHASKDVFVLHTKEQVEAYLKTKRFVFQPLIYPLSIQGQINGFEETGVPWIHNLKDTNYVAELVINPTGEIISQSYNKVTYTQQGQKQWRVIREPLIEKVSLAYAKALAALGFQGPLNLQGKLEQNRFIPFELNARFTGSANGRAFLGYNQIQHCINYYLGRAPIWPPHEIDPLTIMLEAPQTYQVLSARDMQDLQANGLWKIS